MKKLLLLVTVFYTLSGYAQQSPVYSKTKTGLKYRIIPSGNQGATAKPGDWLKLHFTQKRNNDSLLADSYGKMPAYVQAVSDTAIAYNPVEIFPQLRRGDSAIVIMFIDSLLARHLTEPSQLPPFLKAGDSLLLTFRVMEIFRNDSLYQADAQAEYERDRPRQEKESQEQMAKMQEAMQQQRESEWQALEQSGEGALQRKVVEDYLAAKHFTAKKTPKGTYVVIKEQGTGPQATAGKYITVKFTGRILATDSLFESDSYSFQLGKGMALEGWDEGLLLFSTGGKGTLYIPGYMAYGKNPPPQSPFRADEALAFDIEVVKIADEPDQP